MTHGDGKWFFSWLAGPLHEGEARRGIISTAAKWPLGAVITVSFLDGEESLHAAVMKCAAEWLSRSGAGLRFDRVESAGNIRVSFSWPGSWSTIGTTCKEIRDTKRPTMNFGWLRHADEMELRRVVLHEFGHALGLLHEHQSPMSNLAWNKRRVVQDLQASQGWSMETIDRNLFVPVARAQSQFTAFDPSSIMIYPIPAEWLEHGDPIPLNQDLSPTDVAFLREQYPKVTT